MPHMIPNEVSSDTKSSAEKKVFMAMNDMEHTDNWYALHSIPIAKHPTQSQGEADFTVIIPGKGTFVLEVKGGLISCDENNWYSTNRDGETFVIKDPGKEASDASQGFKDFIRDSDFSELSRTMFGFGVIFPDTEIHGKIEFPGIADEQIADKTDMADLKKYLTRLAKYWDKAFENSGFIPKTLEEKNAEQIARLLRPRFEGKLSKVAEIKSIENDIIKLTQRQQMVFDSLAENERIVIRGSAGTGKTLLAINYAEVIAQKGNSVAFFCFNLQLAEYLKKHTEKYLGIYAESFTEYMMQVARKLYSEQIDEGLKQNATNLYREKLPRYFEDAFIELELEQYDYIVVDEAQDILTEPFLDALDLIVKNGLKEGNFCFFMDAEKQNIFNAGISSDGIMEMLKKRCGYFTKFSLLENCRNSLSIIKKIDEIFGTETKALLRDEYGQEVKIIEYEKKEEEKKLLREYLDELTKEGIENKDVVILSPIKYENSIIKEFDEIETLRNRARKQNKIFFSTIQAFKGMESPVVILIEFDRLKREEERRLLYVGMTRARSLLTVFTKRNSST